MWARVVRGLRCHLSSDTLNTRKFLQAPRAFTNCRKASNELTNLAVPWHPPLSQSEKEAILSLRAEGLTIKAIAAKLGRGEKAIGRHLRAITSHKPADISHRRGRPIPQHERDEIHALRAKGLKHREIAAKVGRHEETVRGLLKAKTNSEPVNNNPRKGHPVSEDERAKMFLLRANGLSFRSIAKQIGRDRGVIADHLLSKNGHSPEQVGRRTGGHSCRVSQEERHEMLALRQNGLSHLEIALRLRRRRDTVTEQLADIDRHDEDALRSATKPWGIFELQQLLLLRACDLTMREISQDTGRSVYSIRTAWVRSGCQACPPCPIAFSKEETSSIRSLIRLGATLDKMLEHVSESSRPALEPWLRDVEMRLVRSRVPQPPMSEDDMKLIERLRLDYVRWFDIADRFGRTVDATRNQFKLWQKKNKNRDILLGPSPDC